MLDKVQWMEPTSTAKVTLKLTHLTWPYKYTHYVLSVEHYGDNSRSHRFEGLSEAVASLETVPLSVLSVCVCVDEKDVTQY